jgi:hypothetical protein
VSRDVTAVEIYVLLELLNMLGIAPVGFHRERRLRRRKLVVLIVMKKVVVKVQSVVVNGG